MSYIFWLLIHLVEKLPTLKLQALCKDLERAEVKKWLQQILEILMAERGKEERSEQISKLDAIIKKHEELIPTVLKTQVFLYPCDKSNTFSHFSNGR